MHSHHNHLHCTSTSNTHPLPPTHPSHQLSFIPPAPILLLRVCSVSMGPSAAPLLPWAHHSECRIPHLGTAPLATVWVLLDHCGDWGVEIVGCAGVYVGCRWSIGTVHAYNTHSFNPHKQPTHTATQNHANSVHNIRRIRPPTHLHRIPTCNIVYIAAAQVPIVL